MPAKYLTVWHRSPLSIVKTRWGKSSSLKVKRVCWSAGHCDIQRGSTISVLYSNKALDIEPFESLGGTKAAIAEINVLYVRFSVAFSEQQRTEQQQTNSNQDVFVLWLKLRDGEKMLKERSPPFFKVLQSFRQTSLVYVGSTESWFISKIITFFLIISMLHHNCRLMYTLLSMAGWIDITQFMWNYILVLSIGRDWNCDMNVFGYREIESSLLHISKLCLAHTILGWCSIEIRPWNNPN